MHGWECIKCGRSRHDAQSALRGFAGDFQRGRLAGRYVPRSRRCARQRFEHFVRQRERGAEGALAQVFAVLDAYRDFVLRYPVEYSLIFATAQPPPQRYPEFLAARRRLFEHSVELIQRCIDEGVLAGDAREITHAVWTALHGLLTLHVANQLVHGRTLDQLIRPMILHVLGLAATSASRPKKTPR